VAAGREFQAAGPQRAKLFDPSRDNHQSINQYSFNKSMAERKLIHNRVIRHARCMLYQKCQYNEMFR